MSSAVSALLKPRRRAVFHLRACYEQHAFSFDGEPTPPILCKMQGCQKSLVRPFWRFSKSYCTPV